MRSLPSPDRRADLGFQGEFDVDELGRIARGLTARDIDDKWEAVFADSWLYFHRSWSGLQDVIVAAGLLWLSSHLTASAREPWQTGT